jgi:hypothetical protein
MSHIAERWAGLELGDAKALIKTDVRCQDMGGIHVS